MKIDIKINKEILERIINDDIKAELYEIIDNELEKSLKDINCSVIQDCVNALFVLMSGERI